MADSFPLSPVDYIFTGPGSQPVAFAVFYPHRLDPEKLRNSLERILDVFPLLKTRIRKTSENRYEFYPDPGASIFTTVESGIDFEKGQSISRYLTPITTVEGQPLAEIRLTQVPNGSVLAANVSHAMVDGFSFFHFLSSWARTVQEERILQPVLQREMFGSFLKEDGETVSSEDLLSAYGLFEGPRRESVPEQSLVFERIFVPDEVIQSRLEQARAKHGESFFPNDVLVAMLWKKYIPLWHAGKAESGNPDTYVTCPFDFRRSLSGFPKTYFGCALTFATASMGFRDLLAASEADLALRVKNAVGKMKNDAIVHALSVLDRFRRQRGLEAMEHIHLRHPERGMIVTNLTRMPIRDLDFGFGGPESFLAFAEVPRSAAILPAQNGVEFLVVHPPKENNASRTEG
jgi:hypothetical protein